MNSITGVNFCPSKIKQQTIKTNIVYNINTNSLGVLGITLLLMIEAPQIVLYIPMVYTTEKILLH